MKRLNKFEMQDNIIKKYGFESEWTIWFCELAEELTEDQLLNAYIILAHKGIEPKD